MSTYEQANHDDSPIPMAKAAHSARGILSEQAISIFDSRWVPHSGSPMNGAHGEGPLASYIQSRQAQPIDVEKANLRGSSAPHLDPCLKPMIDRLPQIQPTHRPDEKPIFNKIPPEPPIQRPRVEIKPMPDRFLQEPVHRPSGTQEKPVDKAPWLSRVHGPDATQERPVDKSLFIPPLLPVICNDQSNKQEPRKPFEPNPNLPHITEGMLTGGHPKYPPEIWDPTGCKPNILKPRPGMDESLIHPHWPPILYLQGENQPNGSRSAEGQLPQPRNTTGSDRISERESVNRPNERRTGCFDNFDEERLKNLESWMKDHVVTLKPNSETKLKTGDTIKTTDKAQIMTMPNGDVLTVNKDGTYELKSTTAKVTEHKFDDGTKACVIRYPNGDNIHFGTDHVTKQGRIFAVERGKTFVGIERSDDDPKKR